MLNSTEYEISTAHIKTKMPNKRYVSALELSDVV